MLGGSMIMLLSLFGDSVWFKEMYLLDAMLTRVELGMVNFMGQPG